MSTARTRLSLAAALLVLLGLGAGTSTQAAATAAGAAANPIQRENAAAPAGDAGRDRRVRVAGQRRPRQRARPARLDRSGGALPRRGLSDRLVCGSGSTAGRLLAGLRERRARDSPAGSALRSRDRLPERRLARHRPFPGHALLDERLLPRRARADRRAGRRPRELGAVRRPRAARPALERARAGAREHVGGIQRLGWTEPLLQLQRRRRQPCLLRPAVRRADAEDGGRPGHRQREPPADLGVPARPLPGAVRVRRLVHDGRGHGRPTRRAPPAPSGRGRRPRRVLDDGDPGRLRAGPRPGHQPRLRRGEHRLLADALRGRPAERPRATRRPTRR